MSLREFRVPDTYYDPPETPDSNVASLEVINEVLDTRADLVARMLADRLDGKISASDFDADFERLCDIAREDLEDRAKEPSEDAG